jgi:hypothetical protein
MEANLSLTLLTLRRGKPPDTLYVPDDAMDSLWEDLGKNNEPARCDAISHFLFTYYGRNGNAGWPDHALHVLLSLEFQHDTERLLRLLLMRHPEQLENVDDGYLEDWMQRAGTTASIWVIWAAEIPERFVGKYLELVPEVPGNAFDQMRGGIDEEESRLARRAREVVSQAPGALEWIGAQREVVQDDLWLVVVSLLTKEVFGADILGIIDIEAEWYLAWDEPEIGLVAEIIAGACTTREAREFILGHVPLADGLLRMGDVPFGLAKSFGRAWKAAQRFDGDEQLVFDGDEELVFED